MKKLQGDPVSSKSRIKMPEGLIKLLDRYDRGSDSQIIVCENRRRIWILSEGKVNSPNCFQWNVAPTAAPKDQGVELFKAIVYPHGWRVAFVTQDDDVYHAFTGEIQVLEKPQYRFHRVDENGLEVNSTEWSENPSKAFKKLVKYRKGNQHNPKLYIGVSYHNPQKKLREYLEQNLNSAEFDPDIKESLIKLLDEKTEVIQQQDVSLDSVRRKRKQPKAIKTDKPKTKKSRKSKDETMEEFSAVTHTDIDDFGMNLEDSEHDSLAELEFRACLISDIPGIVYDTCLISNISEIDFNSESFFYCKLTEQQPLHSTTPLDPDFY